MLATAYRQWAMAMAMAMASEEGRSKILVIGGTGYIGKFIVEASIRAGHPTFILIRDSTLSNPAKSPIIQKFNNLSVNLLFGDLYDHQSLVKAIKQVDVVISTVGRSHLADQHKIISAIKEAGGNVKVGRYIHFVIAISQSPDLTTNKYFVLFEIIKRFFPSEFGNDVDRSHAVEPAKSAYAIKAEIRRTIEAEGIPYTYVSNNFFAGYFLPNLSQPEATAAPRDNNNKIVILGDGNIKAVFNTEEDIATYTIKAVDDPRTLNKILYVRPPANTLSFNELVSLWEKKIGNTLQRIYVAEEQLLKKIQDSPPPLNVILSIFYSVYIKGDHTNFEIEPAFGVEASALYHDVKYTTVDEFLNQFV